MDGFPFAWKNNEREKKHRTETTHTHKQTFHFLIQIFNTKFLYYKFFSCSPPQFFSSFPCTYFNLTTKLECLSLFFLLFLLSDNLPIHIGFSSMLPFCFKKKRRKKWLCFLLFILINTQSHKHAVRRPAFAHKYTHHLTKKGIKLKFV